jgi:cobalamin biosynthesis protein CobD/CbiB
MGLLDVARVAVVNAFLNFLPAVVILALIIMMFVRGSRYRNALDTLRREHANCPPNVADPAVAAARVARMMADIREVLAPVSEAAIGEKDRLEAEGWSPTIAEQRAFMLFAEGMNARWQSHPGDVRPRRA